MQNQKILFLIKLFLFFFVDKVVLGNPQSFMNAYSPRNKENVVLKYDFGLNVLKYPRNPKGLIIRSALNVSGGNNNWWNELILYVSDYIKGNHRFSRV